MDGHGHGTSPRNGWPTSPAWVARPGGLRGRRRCRRRSVARSPGKLRRPDGRPSPTTKVRAFQFQIAAFVFYCFAHVHATTRPADPPEIPGSVTRIWHVEVDLAVSVRGTCLDEFRERHIRFVSHDLTSFLSHRRIPDGQVACATAARNDGSNRLQPLMSKTAPNLLPPAPTSLHPHIRQDRRVRGGNINFLPHRSGDG